MTGLEWVVEGRGADAAALADRARCEGLVAQLLTDLALTAVVPAQWHAFPGPGGLTALVLLAESHLALHTFPEHGTLTLNVFCCRPRPPYDFTPAFQQWLGADVVDVRTLVRDYGPGSEVAAR